MSMARRFGREGYRVALVPRSDVRHGAYVADLAARGVQATAHAAYVTDGDRLAGVLEEISRAGNVEFVYYGPGPASQQIVVRSTCSTLSAGLSPCPAAGGGRGAFGRPMLPAGFGGTVRNREASMVEPRLPCLP